ncbi:DNA primase [Erysipelotrichaceae bacterium]|nr:DNA primase [Erysipelotrichaceae bacterium]
MRIPEQLVDEIRSATDIVDVIGDFIPLEKKGRNHVACCPFHEEKTPSFSVSEDKQIYYCFGCHKSGNVFNFLMEHQGLSFPEAVLKTAEYTNIDTSQINLVTHSQSTEHSKHKKLFELTAFVSEFFQYMLMTEKGISAKAYLTKRGVSPEEIKHFAIGFAPNENLLAALLVEKGYSIQDAKDIGILHESADMTKHYDAFRNRIIFPITDRMGNIVAFSGRLLEKSDKSPKYYHSPESMIFQKREILYNFFEATQEIKKHKKVLICEGIFDVLALYRGRIKYAIATLGTALTQQQLDFLDKTSAEKIFVFDNDNAGKNALLKVVHLTSQKKMKASYLTFWEYEEKDLDEIASNQGADVLARIITNPISGIDYLMKYYTNFLNLENNEERQEYTRHILAALQFENQATKEFYLTKVQEQTGYSIEALNSLQNTVIRSYPENIPPEDFSNHYPEQGLVQQIHALTRQEMCELLVIKGVCSDDACINIFQMRPVFTQNLVFRKIMYEILELYRQKKLMDISILYTILDENETVFLSRALYLEEPIDLAIFKDVLAILKSEAEHRYHKDKVSSVSGNSDKQKETLQKYLEFKRKNNKIIGV